MYRNRNIERTNRKEVYLNSHFDFMLHVCVCDGPKLKYEKQKQAVKNDEWDLKSEVI